MIRPQKRGPLFKVEQAAPYPAFEESVRIVRQGYPGVYHYMKSLYYQSTH